MNESGLKNVAKILVGNKLDLENENKRIISYEDGENYANNNNMKFIETSAYKSDNVEDAFILIVKEILEKRNNPQKEEIKTEDMLKNNTKKKQSCCCCN